MIGIRLATDDDRSQLVPLFRGFFGLHRQLLGNPQPLTEDEAREAGRESLAQPRTCTIVAEEEGSRKLVGFARWEEREGAFFGRELYVRAEHRGQGIGSRLQEEVERRARDAGADALFISVIPHNRDALAFVHCRGYDTLNTIELRKELRGKRLRRSQATLFGLQFKLI